MLFLASYALDPRQWLDLNCDFGTADPLVDAIVPGFAPLKATPASWASCGKLGVQAVSRNTVKNIFKEHGLDPGPQRGAGTWDEFLKIHTATLWQCDFYAKKVLTLNTPRSAIWAFSRGNKFVDRWSEVKRWLNFIFDFDGFGLAACDGRLP